MQYAGLIKNDFCAAPGTCTTFFVQGCPLHCPGCHNPETWDFNGGITFTPNVIQEIVDALTANGINRNFCIMGGETLCPENQFLTLLVINSIKEKLPNVKIYLWTGYHLEDIKTNGKVPQILEKVDVVIDGPFLKACKNPSLFMMGSSNQRILFKEKDY